MICVRDLMARGRYSHQTLLRQWSAADAKAVEAALADLKRFYRTEPFSD